MNKYEGSQSKGEPTSADTGRVDIKVEKGPATTAETKAEPKFTEADLMVSDEMIQASQMGEAIPAGVAEKESARIDNVLTQSPELMEQGLATIAAVLGSDQAANAKAGHLAVERLNSLNN